MKAKPSAKTGDLMPHLALRALGAIAAPDSKSSKAMAHQKGSSESPGPQIGRLKPRQGGDTFR